MTSNYITMVSAAHCDASFNVSFVECVEWENSENKQLQKYNELMTDYCIRSLISFTNRCALFYHLYFSSYFFTISTFLLFLLFHRLYRYICIRTVITNDTLLLSVWVASDLLIPLVFILCGLRNIDQSETQTNDINIYVYNGLLFQWTGVRCSC